MSSQKTDATKKNECAESSSATCVVQKESAGDGQSHSANDAQEQDAGKGGQAEDESVHTTHDSKSDRSELESPSHTVGTGDVTSPLPPQSPDLEPKEYMQKGEPL